MPKNEYSVSQNFLTSTKTIRSLLALTDLTAGDTVLEIGAGKGHITRMLAERCSRVLTYEIDPVLSARLSGNLPDNVRLFPADFLRAPLPKGPYKVFANIPFSITTDILHKLTEGPNPPQAAWLIMEKGAAMRFCGQGRESTASLLLKPWWEMRIIHRLRREDFHPMPRVDCVLLELRRKEMPDISLRERRQWAMFIARCQQLGLRRLFTPKQISQAMREAGIPLSATLRYVQWLCLFRCWKRQ